MSFASLFSSRKNLQIIPLSALIGFLVGLVGGMGIYAASQCITNTLWLACFLPAVFSHLSVGIFVGECHEFEEVWGATKKVWKIQGDFWSDVS